MELIVARAKNKVIGDSSKNDLPWPRITQDLQFFRKNTVGKAVLMGRRTWESLPDAYRPLPDRVNIIITRNMVNDVLPSGVYKVGSWDEAREIAASKDLPLIAIGGGELYHSLMENIYEEMKKIFITELENKYSGDVLFKYSFDNWNIFDKEEFSEQISNDEKISGTFYTYQRA